MAASALPPTVATLSQNPLPALVTITPAISATELEATERTRNILEATATSGARQTVAALTHTPAPTRTPKPTPSTTPTADYAYLADAWSVASPDGTEIAFEYPLIYDYPPYSDIGCAPRITGFADGKLHLWVGERIWISIYTSDQSIAELASDFIGDGVSVRNAAQSSIVVGGEPGIRVTYRFGLTNRYGEVVFVKHNDRVYDISFTAGAFCEVYEPQLRAPSEFDAYERLLKTLVFSE